jgi:hypothetical protein
MHYGENAAVRGQELINVFFCRACGVACEIDEIEEIARRYLEALAEARSLEAKK